MAENQTVCIRFKQSSVIKSLAAEKYKPCGIYKRINDAWFSKKKFYKLAKYGFAWIEMIIHGVEAHRLSGKEKSFSCSSK